MYQKRFKKERKVRVRLQQQLESELKRRSQIEDALKASGAPAETLRLISGELTKNLPQISVSNCNFVIFLLLFVKTESQSSDRRNDQRPASADRRTESPYTQSSSRERERDRGDRERDAPSVPTSQPSQQSTQQTPPAADGKPWNYPGLDLMATGAFWQNYSG